MASVLNILTDHGDIPANLADLQEHLGGIPLERISMQPPPGTATEMDVVKWKYCELVDGVIVVKASNMFKALLSVELSCSIRSWAKENNDRGYVFPNVGYRFGDVIRLPDISYVSAETWGNRRLRDVEIGDFAPDLAIDFIVPQNTQPEMKRKRAEYADAGVKLIWTVDTIEVGVWATCPSDGTESNWSGRTETLEAPDILPGFRFSIGDWFAEVEGKFTRKR